MNNHVCEKCNKEFRDSYNLKIHQNKKNDCTKEHQCTQCVKKFPTKFRLKRHLMSKIHVNPFNNITVSTSSNKFKLTGFRNEDLSHFDFEFIKECIFIYVYNKADNSSRKAVRGYTHLLEHIYKKDNNRGNIILRDKVRNIYDVYLDKVYIRVTLNYIVPHIKHLIIYLVINMLQSLIEPFDSDDSDYSEENDKLSQLISEGELMAQEFTDDKVKKVIKDVMHIFQPKYIYEKW